ncbi:outer membrane protein A precursor [Vibrio sp. RC586]|uniref:OmpA family protein n=1 Tax=Vibrio sp. RC586 TaxID=675815 RepID=UPI0001BB8403|nr:OmpA family protein [Vibrio sp. RC586]EEY98219.1 outer membrane protein A precursor [Vibrio sp. RC586]
MKIKILFIINFLAVNSWAATGSSPFFMGVKYGYQLASDDAYKYSTPTGSIWGIYAGLQFSPSWSWDIGYQYHDELNADMTSVTVNTWLIESALRYNWYLQDNLSLYGRFGAAYWNMEKMQPSLNQVSATGLSPLGEVGVSYNLTPRLSLSTGYQYIDRIGKSNTGKYDSHAALISLYYTFGNTDQSVLVDTNSTPVIDEYSVPAEELVSVELLPKTFIFSAKNMDGFFENDSSRLSHNVIEQLSNIAATLNNHPQSRAVIVGHTDSTGSTAYNQLLSEDRAQEAANLLIELGVTPTQIEWRGLGESNPIADNHTADGRAQNRRIEITIPSFQFQE